MLNRMNAFLEAIDKKSEEMADAAAEGDIIHSLQRHQTLEHEAHQQHLQHALNMTPRHHSVGGGLSSRSTPVPSLSAMSTSDAPVLTTSAALRASAEPSGTTAPNEHPYTTAHGTAAAAASTGVRVAPLALPTKLPSFRPSLADTDASASAGLRGGLRRSTGLGGGVGSAGGGSMADIVGGTPSRVHDVAPPSSDAAAAAAAAIRDAYGDVYRDATGSSGAAAAAAAVERLQARCTALEAEKAKLQHEAATHKAQGTATRDALWKAEQEARASRAAQRDAEQALAAYKETAQRLLEEAQQEVRRAQAAGRSDSGAGGAEALAEQQQQQQAGEARELHQRLELLQAEHAALLADVDRHQQEAAKAATELQRLQAACHSADERVDALQLDVHAVRESLAGEVAAHADTKAALRRLLAQQRAPSSPQQHEQTATATAAADGGSGSTTSEEIASGDVTQLQREVREARQRHQLLLLQASNRQAALDTAEREIADLKARYYELARQFDDAQVEVDAGFRGASYPSAAAGFGVSRDGVGVVGSGQRSRGADHAAGFTSDKAGLPSAAPDALRRNPVMVQIARKYGVAGRSAVSALATLDTVALRLGRVLTQSRWVWRVMLVGYVLMLQVWVVLMVLASLASDD